MRRTRKSGNILRSSTVEKMVSRPKMKIILSAGMSSVSLKSQSTPEASSMPPVFMKLLVAISRPFSSAPLFCCRRAFRGTMKRPQETPSIIRATAVLGYEDEA